MATKKKTIKKNLKKKKCSIAFQPVNVEALFPVLDAIAWLDLPTVKQISQFAGLDPRTTGKVIKNAETIGIIQQASASTYMLSLPYPYKGDDKTKTSVVKESLIRMPLMQNIKQFLKLGDNVQDSLRKAATVIGVSDYDSKAFDALIKWANKLDILSSDVIVEDLVDQAINTKERRHVEEKEKTVVFISHSSKDKPFVRQLAADLTSNNISIWIDEQRIKVGDSIVEKISQGLVESDYFLLVMSRNSVESEWVKKELNHALITEIEQKKVKVLPVKISEVTIPDIIKDKKYADFSESYRDGLSELIKAIKE